MPRRRNRNCTYRASYPLVSAAIAGREQRIIRQISDAEGETMVRAKRAIVLRVDGAVVGFEMSPHGKEVKPRAVVAEARPSMDASQATFSRAESEAIWGMRGKSRTVGQTEEEAVARLRAGLPEMDLVQAAKVKQEFYRAVH